MRTFSLLLFCSSLLLAEDRHVVLISLDGYPAYALRDPHTPAPTLRRLIAEGAWAPDGMTPVNPTVTWPNHTSMVTGVDASRHGVLYNGMPVRKDGSVRIDPWVPKLELVQAPTVYDLAHAHGLTSAEVDWVAVQDAPTIDFAFSEVPKKNAPIVTEMIGAAVVSADDIDGFAKSPITYRDEIWTQAAIHILQKHHPNLLLVHLLTTDSTQHKYGARSLGAISALALADRQVERLIDAARSAGILAQTTFLVVSDHGFHTAKRQIRPAALLKQLNVIGVTVVPEGGTAMIYGKVAADSFRDIEGVSKVITPDQFPEHGFPPAGGRMADLVLVAADGYAFADGLDGAVVSDIPAGSNAGNHGYLNSRPDMRPIFVAWGAGINAGARVDGVRTVDVAPTIAKLLGFEMTNISGKVVAAALK